MLAAHGASAIAVRAAPSAARSAAITAAASAAATTTTVLLARRRTHARSIGTAATTQHALHRARHLSRPRTAAPQQQKALALIAHRAYSTAPNQEQVASTFGASFLQFVLILSRIARITVYTALGLLLAGAVAFEGTHQYVERVLLPRAGRASDGKRVQEAVAELLRSGAVNEEELACLLSFVEEAQDDAWVPSSLRSRGTDPRLGWRARHALRSAFIATEWGAGPDPSFFLAGSSFFGRPMQSTGTEADVAIQRAAATLDHGLAYAEAYLLSALQEAEKRGIRLPEPAAQRAQLLAQGSTSSSFSSPSATAASTSILVPEVDPTVLALEMRLASVRERQGKPRAQQAAVETYERIFDALSSSASPLDASFSAGHVHIPASNTPTAARLVRLATKIGTLHSAVGRRDEAQSWYLRAVELASEDRLARLEAAELDKAEVEEKPSSGWAFWRRGGGGASKAPEPVAGVSFPAATKDGHEAAASNPGLTRALISALIGLSAWYASAPGPGSSTPQADGSAPTGTSWLASLEEAVRVQSSALHLVRLEQARAALAAPSASTPASAAKPAVGKAEELHATWIELHDGTLCVHLAETLYGLQAQPQHGRKHALPFTAPLSRRRRAGKTEEQSHTGDALGKNRYALSLGWLRQAEEQANDVLDTLATPISDAEARLQAARRAARDKKVGEEARAGYAAVEQALPTSFRMRPAWRVAADGGAGAKGGSAAAGNLDPALAVPAFRLLRDASRMRNEIERMVAALERKGSST